MKWTQFYSHVVYSEKVPYGTPWLISQRDRQAFQALVKRKHIFRPPDGSWVWEHPWIGSSDAGLAAVACSDGNEILILLQATIMRNCTAYSQREKQLCVLVLGQWKNCSPPCQPPHLLWQHVLGLNRKVAGWESGNLSSRPLHAGRKYAINQIEYSKKKFAGFKLILRISNIKPIVKPN